MALRGRQSQLNPLQALLRFPMLLGFSMLGYRPGVLLRLSCMRRSGRAASFRGIGNGLPGFGGSAGCWRA